MNFILLLKRQWFENFRKWITGSLAIVAILSFLFLLTWNWRTNFNGDTSHGIFLLVLFGGGGLFISSILQDLGNRQKGIWLLLLPGSALAKLGIALFYGILAYLIVYFGIFYAVLGITLWLLGADATGWGHFDLIKNNFYHSIFVFINFQSVILSGSVYFNKSQFLKTLLVIITGLFVVFNGNALILQAFTHQNAITSNIPLASFQFVYHGENIYVYPPAYTEPVVKGLLWVIVPVTLWLFTWLRLKEKEL